MMRYIHLSGLAASIPCLVVLTSCSPIGPNNLEIQASLQNQLPSQWEISSLEIKERENTGNKVEPNVSARFQAVAKLKEDTFIDSGKLDSVDSDLQQEVTFVSKSENKGKTVDLYGTSNSRLVSEKWQTNFQFTSNPTTSAGSPRTSFGDRTILKDSKEQEEFVTKATLQMKKNEEFIATHSIICERPTPGHAAHLHPDNFVSVHCMNDTVRAVKDGTVVKLKNKDNSRLESIGESVSPDRFRKMIEKGMNIYSLTDIASSVSVWVKDSSHPEGELLLDNEYEGESSVVFTIGDSVKYGAVDSSTIPSNLRKGWCVYNAQCNYREVIHYKKDK
jgi:hypothetical protein